MTEIATTECISGTKTAKLQPAGWIRQTVTLTTDSYNVSFRLRVHDGAANANYTVRLLTLASVATYFTMDLKNLDNHNDAGTNSENTVRRINGQIKPASAGTYIFEIRNTSTSNAMMIDDICLWKSFDPFDNLGQVLTVHGWTYPTALVTAASEGIWINASSNIDIVSPSFPVKAGVYYQVIIEIATDINAIFVGSISITFNGQPSPQIWSTSNGDFTTSIGQKRSLVFKSTSTLSTAKITINVTSASASARVNIRKSRVYEVNSMQSTYCGQPTYSFTELWTNTTRPTASKIVNTYAISDVRAQIPDFAGDAVGLSLVDDVFENTTMNAPIDGSWYAVSLAAGDVSVLVDDVKRADFTGYSNDHTFMINGGSNIKAVSKSTDAIISHLDIRKIVRPTISGQLLKNPDFLEGYYGWSPVNTTNTKAGRGIRMSMPAGATIQQTITLPIGNYRVISRTDNGSATFTHGMNVKRGTTALANRAAMPSVDGHTSFKNTVAGSITFTMTSNAGLSASGVYLFTAPNYTDRPKNNDFTNGQSFWMPFSSYSIITPDDYDSYAQLLAGQYIESYSSGCTITASKSYTITIMNRSTAAVQLIVSVGSTVLSTQSLASTSGNWQTRTITFSSGSSAGNAVIKITAATGSPTDIKYVSMSS